MIKEKPCKTPTCKGTQKRHYERRYAMNILICDICGNAEGIPGF